MRPTISLCLFVHNDLVMLRQTLMHQVKWADEICVLDMASRDGTGEFCRTWLRPGDRYLYREENTCARWGFAEARNAVNRLATCDWVYSTDADQLVDWESAKRVYEVVERANGDVIALWGEDILKSHKYEAHQIEEAARALPRRTKESRRELFRRNSGVEYRGYLHEELYRGEVNCAGEAQQSELKRIHFSGWCNNDLRVKRYYWMMFRALKEPELQKWTNSWWYDTFCVEQASEIQRLAGEYEGTLESKREIAGLGFGLKSNESSIVQ